MKAAFFLAGASLLVLACSAEAARAAATSQPVASSNDQSNLSEVVVTAQRRSERLKDVPVTVTALSSKDLEKAGISSLRDIQNIVSGFTFGGLGTVSQPSIRGVSTLLSATGSENPNAVYVDGIYQASQAALGSDLPDVDRIEVLKGPQGTLFGRNATGGAIQIITKSPSFTPGVDLSVDSGYFTGGTSHAAPHEAVRAFITGPIVNDLLAASLSGGYDWTPGFLTNDVTGRETGVIEKQNLRAKLLFTPNNSTRITLGAFYINNNDQGNLLGTPYEGLSATNAYPGSVTPTQPWHVAYEPGVAVAAVRQYGYSLNMQFDLAPGRLTFLTGYTNTYNRNLNDTAESAGTIGCVANFACIQYDFRQPSREISQEINFASHDFGIFSFVGGLYYYNAKGATTGIIQEGLVPGGILVQQTDFQTTAYAAYGEATIKPTDALSFHLGLREGYEPHADQSSTPPSPLIKKTFTSTTPHISVMYRLNSALNAYASYSVGYKSGLTGVTNTASVPQFAPVAPETLNAYEVGLKYGSHDLTLDGSFFYYDYKNKQEQTFLGTTTIIVNTGPVQIFGFDFDGNYRINSDFNLRGTLSWIPVAKYLDFPDATGQSSTLRVPFDPSMPPFNCAPGGGCGGFEPTVFNATGKRLTRTPTITGSETLAYQHPMGQGVLDGSATVSYSSTVLHDITGTIRQPAYATLSGQIGYRFNGSGLRIGIYGRNITNTVYIVNGLTSSAGFNVGYSAPREIGVALNYGF